MLFFPDDSHSSDRQSQRQQSDSYASRRIVILNRLGGFRFCNRNIRDSLIVAGLNRIIYYYVYSVINVDVDYRNLAVFVLAVHTIVPLILTVCVHSHRIRNVSCDHS